MCGAWGRGYSGTPAVCSQVVVPTRVGQGYVYEASQAEQDEYDTPRHLLAPGSQDIYDVPPVRGLLPNQYGQEVSVDQRHGRGQGLGLALGQLHFLSLAKAWVAQQPQLRYLR